MNTLIIYTGIYLIAALSSSVVAYTTVPKSTITKQSQQNFANRRAFLSTTIASIATVATSNPNRVLAANDDLEEVYFGAGCFWHVQQYVIYDMFISCALFLCNNVICHTYQSQYLYCIVNS